MLLIIKNFYLKFSDIKLTIKVNLALSLFWLFIGLTFSLISQLQIILPTATFGIRFLNYGYLKPIINYSLFFGAFLGLVVASYYYIIQNKFNINKFLGLQAYGFTKMHHFGVLLAILSIIFGYNKGHEFGEGFWWSDLFLAAGFYGAPLVTFIALTLEKKKLGDLVLGILLFSLIGGAVAFFLGNFSFPTGMLTSVFPFSGLSDLAMQSLYLNALLYLVLNLSLIALLYYFLPLYYKTEIYSEKIPLFMISAILFLGPFAACASLLMTNANLYLQNLGIFCSISLNLAVLSGILNAKYTINRNLKKFNSDSITLLLSFGLFFMNIYTIARIIFAPRFIASKFTFTSFDPNNLSQNIEAYALIIIISISCILYQLVTQKKLAVLSLVAFFWIVGGVFHLIGSLTSGITEYVNLSKFDMDGQNLLYKSWEDIFFTLSLAGKGNHILRYIFSFKSLILIAQVCFSLGGLILILEILIKSMFSKTKNYNLPDLENKEII